MPAGLRRRGCAPSLALALGVLGAVHGRAGDAEPTVRDAEVSGAPAVLPASLSLVDLQGRSWTREALAGRLVVLDFWATWCAPCVRERARLAELRETLLEDRVLILSVNLDHGDRRSLVAWLNRYRLSWPQVHEPLGWASPLVRRFAVPSLPWTVAYDPEGRLVGAGRGLQALAGRLEPLLGRSGSS
jgi:thiol-disulfide isomerase/thioredoxin